jgi:hypothetical protein
MTIIAVIVVSIVCLMWVGPWLTTLVFGYLPSMVFAAIVGSMLGYTGYWIWLIPVVCYVIGSTIVDFARRQL